MRLERRAALLLLLAPVLAYVLTFLLPVLTAAQMSVRPYGRMTGIGEGFTAEHYADIVTDPYFFSSWVITLSIAFRVAVVTTVLAAVLGYLMWRRGGRTRSVLTTLVLLPLFISGVVRAYGWIPMTGPNGLLPRITDSLGLAPMTVMFNESAVVLGLVHIMLPYAVIVVIAAYDNVPESAIRSSLNLGASQLRTIAGVIVPLARNGFVSAFLLVFAIASAAYAIPAILGGGRVNVVSIAIFQEQTATRNWPLASALAIALMLITVVIMAAQSRLGRISVET